MKYDYKALVLWWESHGKPSVRMMSEALGIPQHAARIALRDHPEYGGRKYCDRKLYSTRPKDHLRRAAIVTWWREHGKPRLRDVAWEFGITRERVRQILSCESDYDRCAQGVRRQKIQDALDLHPDWSAALIARETSCSDGTVRGIARHLGHEFPAAERPAYKPSVRVLKILELHKQGLLRPDIAERLGLDLYTVHKTLKRALARLPEYSKIPIVDGRRFARRRVSDRLLDIKTGEPPAT